MTRGLFLDGRGMSGFFFFRCWEESASIEGRRGRMEIDNSERERESVIESLINSIAAFAAREISLRVGVIIDPIAGGERLSVLFFLMRGGGSIMGLMWELFLIE